MHVRSIVFAAALLSTAPLFAQTPAEEPPASAAEPPKPEAVPCETPDEVTARVHFERALRAFLEGKKEPARFEIKAGLAASPRGRFAAALRDLDRRIDAGGMPAVATGPREVPNARAEMISAATLTGGLIGGLTAGALETDGKGAVGLVMLGTAGGLVSSILATSGGPVRPAYPQMFETGAGYGAFAVLAAYGLANGGGNPAGPVAAAVLAGGLGGLGAVSAFNLSGGDAGASATGLVFVAGIPVLVEIMVISDIDASSAKNLVLGTALVGGTVGLLGGPLLNQNLNWSLNRWRLISLGGYVGALFGIGTAVLADAKGRGGAGLVAGGALLGLGASALLTSGFDADEPREARRALLDVSPSGKVRLGSLGEALKPAVFIGRGGKAEVGAAVALLGGKF